MKSPQSTVSMADKVALIDSLCAKARILPVITIAREQDILPLADALAAGGLTALEVTLRSEFGLKAIQVLREQRPELCTGAGTVLDRHMLEAAEVAGSQFIVTPGITRRCRSRRRAPLSLRRQHRPLSTASTSTAERRTRSRCRTPALRLGFGHSRCTTAKLVIC